MGPLLLRLVLVAILYPLPEHGDELLTKGRTNLSGRERRIGRGKTKGRKMFSSDVLRWLLLSFCGYGQKE